MSSNAVQNNIDAAQLTQIIRDGIERVSSQPLDCAGKQESDHPIAKQSLENLRAIDREIGALALQLENGEPLPETHTLRGRIGAGIKRRLYRLLWWQARQFKALVALVIRLGREETDAFNVLSERIERDAADIKRLKQSLSECKQQVHDGETRLRQLESAQLRLQAAEIERNVKDPMQLETSLASLRQELNQTLAQRIETVLARVQQETAQREQLSGQISELGLFAHQNRTALTLQDRRITVFLEDARKLLGEPLADDQLCRIVNRHDTHRYDSLYLAFEDLFRGGRDEIKARQSIYLPLLTDAGIGSEEMLVLDVGCGRGEWLELLRDHNLHARGVDCNEAMIEYCQRAGLQVIQYEALPYLRSLPDSSLGCITSFHMVEHLPFEITLALIDEALRVLKSGGILVLETPNPQNILVGAYNFYVDPTHLRPLPSPMLRFFVEARGFCDVHVLDLHPYPEAVRFPDDGRGMANRLSDYLYGPQDYAVIGRKL